jgi:hypothetical protein
MKINGYKLRESAADSEFADSLHKFPSEEKESPISIAGRIEHADLNIALLQVAQMRYNLAVSVRLSAHSKSMSLAEAIKISAVADRNEKLWKGTTVSPSRRRSYDVPTLERDGTLERAVPTITAKEILEETTRASRATGQLRAALAAGNATEVELEDLDSSLFE